MKSLTSPLEDRFQDMQLLHQGAAVTTYAAQQSEAPQSVVIKMLDLKKIKAWKALELFEREVAVLQGLDHAAIPEYIDAFEAQYAGQDYYCLLQQRVRGQTLQQLIDAQTRFSETEIIALATQLLEVLVYLHGLNPPIIHRDIKPANLIWHAGKLAILDFGGVLKHLGPAQSTVVGTYGYMAPEQFQGKASVRSDLYSVGMTLVHALSHVHPSTMESQGLAVKIEHYLDCSLALRQWLQRLTALAPEDRFQHATEALSSLINKESALALASPANPSGLAVQTESTLPVVWSSELSQHYQIEKSPQKTKLQSTGRNVFSVRQGLKIDLFAVLPALATFGLLKVAGVTALYAALLPTLIFLPIAMFILLSTLYSKNELEINATEVIYKCSLFGLTLSEREYDLGEGHFTAFALGKSAAKKALPESVGALKWLSDADDERIIGLGLSLATYQALAEELNQEMVRFSHAPETEPSLE